MEAVTMMIIFRLVVAAVGIIALLCGFVLGYLTGKVVTRK